ncbi:hypothetical protein D4R71_01505 [bacterium]|nr:MAG: hypothetical protein D4R71_01505 [bacterium]
MKGYQISPKCPECNINMILEEIGYPNIDETKNSASYTNSTSSYETVDITDELEGVKIYTYTCPKCGHQEQILEE